MTNATNTTATETTAPEFFDITITVPNTIHFSSREENFSFKLSEVNPDAMADLFAVACEVGFSKSAIDSGSGAVKYAKENKISVEAATRELIEKRLAVFYAGNWGAARGTGTDPIDAELIVLLRDTVKNMRPALYKKADAEGKDILIREFIAQLPAPKLEALRIRAAYSLEEKAALAAQRAKAKAKAMAMLADLDLGLDLSDDDDSAGMIHPDFDDQ